jgi:hypothetical protein
MIPLLLIVAASLFSCTCLIVGTAWITMHTPLGQSVDSCISYLQNVNRRENSESKPTTNAILNENYIDMAFVIPADNNSALNHDMEQPKQETNFGGSNSAVQSDEIYTAEELDEFDELRSSTPHIWQENSSNYGSTVQTQAQVHTSKAENTELSPVKYLEGHVRYLSPTMEIRYMLEKDAVEILNDKIEYE